MQQQDIHLKSILNKFENFLLAHAPKIQSFHPHYESAVWEMMKNGGKRFRPALMFCVIDALAPQLLHKSFLAALSLECIHTYSLIHDDLPCMDNASLRRNHPTLHTKYGETLALLIGDGLNTHAFALLNQSELSDRTCVRLSRILAENSGIGGMVLGQVLDCEFENTPLNLEQLRMIHTHKTAKLIATSLCFGMIIAQDHLPFSESMEQEIKTMYEFGITLGVYFQLRDDLIDACLSPQSAGKTTQNDGDKNSYVNLLGLEKARDEYHNMQQAILRELENLDKAVAHNLRILLQDYFKEI